MRAIIMLSELLLSTGSGSIWLAPTRVLICCKCDSCIIRKVYVNGYIYSYMHEPRVMSYTVMCGSKLYYGLLVLWIFNGQKLSNCRKFIQDVGNLMIMQSIPIITVTLHDA